MQRDVTAVYFILGLFIATHIITATHNSVIVLLHVNPNIMQPQSTH